MRLKVSLSNTAFDGLVLQARTHGFIRSWSVRPRGLSNYIDHLVLHSLSDTRPAPVQAATLSMLEVDELPYWSLELTRYPRLLMVQPDTVARLCEIAFTYGIVNPRRAHASIHGYCELGGAVLEAVGIGWLTPQEWIENTKPYTSRQHYKGKVAPIWQQQQ